MSENKVYCRDCRHNNNIFPNKCNRRKPLEKQEESYYNPEEYITVLGHCNKLNSNNDCVFFKLKFNLFIKEFFKQLGEYFEYER